MKSVGNANENIDAKKSNSFEKGYNLSEENKESTSSSQLLDKKLIDVIFKTKESIFEFRKLNKYNLNNFDGYLTFISCINNYLQKIKVQNKNKLRLEQIEKQLTNLQIQATNIILEKGFINNVNQFRLIHQNTQETEYALFNRHITNIYPIESIDFYIINNFQDYFAQQQLLTLTNQKLQPRQIRKIIKYVTNQNFQLQVYFFYKDLLESYEHYLLEKNGIKLLEHQTLIDENIFETLNNQGISNQGLKQISIIGSQISEKSILILIERLSFAKKGNEQTYYLQMLNEILQKTQSNEIDNIICPLILDKYPSENGLYTIIEKNNKYSISAGKKGLEKFPNSEKIVQGILKNIPTLKNLVIEKINGKNKENELDKKLNHEQLALWLARLFMIGTQIPNLRQKIKPIARSLTLSGKEDEHILSEMIPISKDLVSILIGILKEKITNITEYESFVTSIDNLIKSGNYKKITNKSINKNNLTIQEYVTFQELLIEFKKSLLEYFLENTEFNLKNLKKIHGLNNEYEKIIVDWIIKNEQNYEIIDYVYYNFGKKTRESYFKKFIKTNKIRGIKLNLENLELLFNTGYIPQPILFQWIFENKEHIKQLGDFLINNFDEYYSNIFLDYIIRNANGKDELVTYIPKINTGFKAYKIYETIKNGTYKNAYNGDYKGGLSPEETYYILKKGSLIDELLIQDIHFENFSIKYLKKLIIDVPVVSKLALRVYFTKYNIDEKKDFFNGLYDILFQGDGEIKQIVIDYILNQNPTPFGVSIVIKNFKNESLRAGIFGLNNYPKEEVVLKAIIGNVPSLAIQAYQNLFETDYNIGNGLNYLFKQNPTLFVELIKQLDTNKLIKMANNPHYGNLAFEALMEKNVSNDFLLEIILENKDYRSNIAFEKLCKNANNSYQISKIIYGKSHFAQDGYIYLLNKKNLDEIEALCVFENIDEMKDGLFVQSEYCDELNLTKKLEFNDKIIIHYLRKYKFNMNILVNVLNSTKLKKSFKLQIIEWFDYLQKNNFIGVKISLFQLTMLNNSVDLPAHTLRSLINNNCINPMDYAAYWQRQMQTKQLEINIHNCTQLLNKIYNDPEVSMKIKRTILQEGKKLNIKIKKLKNRKINQEKSIEQILEDKWKSIENNEEQMFYFMYELAGNQEINIETKNLFGEKYSIFKPKINSVSNIAFLLINIPIMFRYIDNFVNKKYFIEKEDIIDEIEMLKNI